MEGELTKGREAEGRKGVWEAIKWEIEGKGAWEGGGRYEGRKVRGRERPKQVWEGNVGKITQRRRW